MVLILLKNQGFKVKSNYKVLRGGNYFHWQTIVCAPPRWLSSCSVKLGKTLTMGILRKCRGIIIMHWCLMSIGHGESVANLFLHCAVTQELWFLVFRLFVVSWAVP